MAQHYKNESITKSRVKVFLGWEHFNSKGNVAPGRMDQNLCGRLWRQHDRAAVTLSVASLKTSLDRPSRDSLQSLDYKPAKVGDSFGPSFSNHVFRLDVEVPSALHNQPVHLLWDSNSEAMVLTEDGHPHQGLVGGDHWARRADYLLFPDSPDGIVGKGEKIRVYVEIACNGLFGAGRGGDIEPPDMNKYYTLEECCIAAFDPLAWGLIHDVTMLSSLAEHLPDTPRRAQALHVANKIVNVVDVANPKTYSAGRLVADEYFKSRNGESQAVVHTVLHSHIDLAWLWPMASTPAKGARTFATHLRLMEEYPECIYVQSQAQLYEWVKERYPSLWEEVCDRVKKGIFIPVGATWVEMDCNIPCGESLVRQFLFGQNFFESNFGMRCREFWLPDTFGYAGQLPQIMKSCGVDYFMTQKLSWNLFNKFPHSTFVWEGMDGSRVLAHMPPADTYNAQAFPEEVLRTAHKNKDASVFNAAMMLVGHGDGGGGASPAMLESIERMRDVDGTPKVQFSTPARFFAEVSKKERELPRWVGELYFELHRGTYTAQARTKQKNRQCELLLRDLEFLSSQAVITGRLEGKTFAYPENLLAQCWKLVLKNCFHDTLPGSCIGEVYEETARDYEFVLQQCTEASEKALTFIQSNVSDVSMTCKDSENESVRNQVATNGPSERAQGLLFFRSTPWNSVDKRPLVIEVDKALHDAIPNISIQACFAGSKHFNNQYTGREQRYHPNLIALKSRPSGFGLLNSPEVVAQGDLGKTIKPASIVSELADGVTEYILSNSRVKARVSSTGVLKSMLLLSPNGSSREAISYSPNESSSGSNGGNKIVIYDDVPQFWCAWDTEVYAFEKYAEIEPAMECKVSEEGPLRVSLHLKYPLTSAGTRIEQWICLCIGSSRLDFRTEIVWKESRKIIRVLFDTEVRSAHASYDAQFGYVKRPTTFNHSWEIAKFESVGHQYCDISEYQFGVALLNNCKYGYSVRDSTMRLSLLRAAKSPDDNADIGLHHMTYSLLPHWETFPTPAVLEEAADLNWPPVMHANDKNEVPSGFSQSGADWAFKIVPRQTQNGLQSVMISAVKLAEKRPGNLVIRLYESLGARGVASLRCPVGMKVEAVRSCNMLEDLGAEEDENIIVKMTNSEEGTEVLVPFTPFQIRTLMLEFDERCISSEVL